MFDEASGEQLLEMIQLFNDTMHCCLLMYTSTSSFHCYYSGLNRFVFCLAGFVDIYRGRHYGKTYPPKKVNKRYNSGKSRGGQKEKGYSEHEGTYFKYTDCDAATRRSHRLTIRYIPGHYQPLLPELTKLKKHSKDQNGSSRPTLEDIIDTLEKWKVLHVVTDGRAR